MYSKEVERIFSKKRIKVGDKIKIVSQGKTFVGLLMPKTAFGDPSTIVIKLDSGYNAGIKYEKGVRVEKMETGKPIKFVPAEELPPRDLKKPTVTILGTGGTIGSRIEYKTGAVYPAFSPADLAMAIPEVKEIANIDGRKLFDLFSNDITVKHWEIIAKEIEKEVKKKVDGIILTHGTDTMCYTAAAMSFALRGLPIPVIMVGSQRSSDRGSSDHYDNMLSAVLASAKSDVAEVSICMHAKSDDDFNFLHQGNKCRKMHTSRRDAFRSINVLPFAKIFPRAKKIEYLRNNYRRRGTSKLEVDAKFNPSVAVLYEHPNLPPKFIEHLADAIDGLVMIATGLGHVHTNYYKDPRGVNLIPSLKRLIDSGIPVVFAPQTLYGRFDFKVYASGRQNIQIGVIGDGMDWTPETAYVKLMWVLAHTKNMKKIEEMMTTNFAGEISERILEPTFLV